MKATDLPPVEYVWDFYSRCVPEDGYSIKDLNWVIGEDVMLKKDFQQATKALLHKLYDHIKHGDAEHQAWLKNEIDKFYSNEK